MRGRETVLFCAGANVGERKHMIRKGIDVSSYQGAINWKRAAAAGVDFAILKIIRKDLNPDKRFEANWAGCQEAGVPILGVYNYSYATTVDKARSDAQRVIRILDGRKAKVWLDIEDDCLEGLGARLADIINAYGQVITAAGLEFGVYTGRSFYNSYIRKYAGAIKHRFWIARYPSSRPMTIDQNPDASKKPTIEHMMEGWQFSSHGRVPGVSGNVDLDIWYADDGSDSDLKREPEIGAIPSEAVRSLQEALNATGITDKNGNKLVADGIMGLLTESAIRKVTLKAGPFDTTRGRYMVGSTGPMVQWLQMQLNTVIGNDLIELLGKALEPDGRLCADTRLAIGLYQEMRGLKQDYIAGVNTITALLAA